MDAEQRLYYGVLLAGSWINMALYTVEVVLCFHYMQKWKLQRAYKYGFWFLLLNDAVATIAVCTNVFFNLAQGTVGEGHGSVPTVLMSTGISAFMEQIFLIYRYWKIAQSAIVSVFLILIVVAHVRCSFSFTALVCTCADVAIAVSIVWSLRAIKPMWRSTQHLIRMLVLNTMTSGAVVATVTLLSMVTIIMHGVEAIIFSLFFASMGRVYSLTILVNFIVRNSHQSVANSMHISEYGPSSAVGGSLLLTNTNHGAAESRAPRLSVAAQNLSTFRGNTKEGDDDVSIASSHSQTEILAPAEPRPSYAQSRRRSNMAW
ncbi:hypothetical protein B0H10DRAFT_2056533 [Mycena sp. CBHHK59/15]|nr:hypothetical protein B0H10DRAFT_2056533 [Mycena sp. CBHHK59/15]